MLDLMFSLSGDKIPADHGYHLHSALSELFPSHHDPKMRGDAGVHPIFGIPCGERMLALNSSSRLILRVETEKVADYLDLCGKRLNIGGCVVTAGMPSSRKLIPAAALRSRIVTIKGFTDPEEFLKASQKQIDDLGIGGRVHLVARRNPVSAEGKTDNRQKSPFLKRTISIRGRDIVGFSAAVTELTAEESILLQIKGVGGRRSMGCGIFVPLQ